MGHAANKPVRRTIKAFLGVLVLLFASAVATDALLPSDNYRTHRIVETVSALPSTVAFADSDMYGMSPEDVNRTLDLMTAIGVSTVRILIPWAGVQPAPDAFNWGQVDTMVDAAMARGMGVLGVLNSSPQWAVVPGGARYSGHPASPAAYGDFAGAVADRYRGRVSAYEVWNEQNSFKFFNPPDPAAYTALLKAAYPKIKGSDPAATVVAGGLSANISFGGLTLDPVAFVSGMYGAGAKGNLDALAYHPYHYKIKFSEGGARHPDSPINQLARIRQLMVDNGDSGAKIWATEYGEPTSRVDEAEQAAFIADMLGKWRTLDYVGPVFIYTTRDRMTGSSDEGETMGVYRSDWTPKPAAQTVQSFATGQA